MVVSGSGEEKEKPAVKGNEYETMSDQETRTKFQSALKYSKSILEGTHEVSFVFFFFFVVYFLLSFLFLTNTVFNLFHAVNRRTSRRTQRSFFFTACLSKRLLVTALLLKQRTTLTGLKKPRLRHGEITRECLREWRKSVSCNC